MRHSQYEFDFAAPVAVPAPPGCPQIAPPPVPGSAPDQRRQRRGRLNYHAGLAAEAAVERYLTGQGLRCLDRRWRGPGGEIDLIFRQGDCLVFVEVKAGRSHEEAASRIGQRQADRIAASALAYLDRLPAGASEMRLDVALVDGQGRVSVLENAFAGWW